MLIVHGGAGPWKDDNHDVVLAAMQQAVEAGAAVLHAGRSALDAVEAATIVLEDHPLFDAGVGSHLNDQGEVEMDALITDGSRLDFGAIASAKHVRNPIRLARRVMMDTNHRFFVGAGADALAARFDLPRWPNILFVTPEELARFRRRIERNDPTALMPDHGTVGAVALDASGDIASATSTGGSPFKMQGRVGDVPIFGAGGYADNRYGGASSTGVGENIMRHLLSKAVVDLIAAGAAPLDAAVQAVNAVASSIPDPEVGVITVDASGRVGAAHTTAHMPIAWIDTDGNPHTAMTGPYNL